MRIKKENHDNLQKDCIKSINLTQKAIEIVAQFQLSSSGKKKYERASKLLDTVRKIVEDE